MNNMNNDNDNNNLLVPKLRFKEFENNGAWSRKKLGEVAEKVLTKNISDINIVLSNSANDGVVIQSQYFKKNIASNENLDRYILMDIGDFVYNPRISSNAKVGPISKNKIVKGLVSPLYTVFRFKQKQTMFYEYYFKTDLWIEYIKINSNTGARHDRISISSKAFMGVPVLYTTLAEQEKIAECLSSLDEVDIRRTSEARGVATP